MFEIAIICVITLIILKIVLNINFKSIKKMEIGNSEELKEISNKFYSDEEICKEILTQLENENVKIKIDETYNSCLYTVFNNKITIGKFQQNYMKIQTIAHECLHASQNKKMLWSNFIFTNIYIVYFIIILVLTFFNKIPYTNIHMTILFFFSLIQYILRFSLENEAMIKAPYVAEEYLKNSRLLTEKEEESLMKEYNRVNKIGIPFMNYYLISMNIVKILLYAFVSLAK